jgi:hypothetical protein
MARRRKPTLAAIRDNPTLHPRAFALAQERFPRLDWHFFAQSPDSSQAFALSAFLPVLEFPDKDLLLERFVTAALPGIPPRLGRTWGVHPEYSDPVLLGESGRGEATSVDILLAADDAVVCVECKFRVDARQGWGRCSQPPRLCEGFHGPGSDRKGTTASCRLEVPDGHRGPRLYWRAARGHFRDEVFALQRPGDVCPFGDEYQLVRNYLLAARCAERGGMAHFGVIAMAPAARAAPLVQGIELFRRAIVLPGGASRVAFVAFEDYVDLLARGSTEGEALATFLTACLATATHTPRRRLQNSGTQ